MLMNIEYNKIIQYQKCPASLLSHILTHTHKHKNETQILYTNYMSDERFSAYVDVIVLKRS